MSDRDEEGILIGLVSVSDRASSGVYEDKGIPALREWCTAAIETPVRFAERLIPDDRYTIEKTLTELVDDEKCDLVLTTGGTGPSRRDVTPEATLAVATRELPGSASRCGRSRLNSSRPRFFRARSARFVKYRITRPSSSICPVSRRPSRRPSGPSG